MLIASEAQMLDTVLIKIDSTKTHALTQFLIRNAEAIKKIAAEYRYLPAIHRDEIRREYGSIHEWACAQFEIRNINLTVPYTTNLDPYRSRNAAIAQVEWTAKRDLARHQGGVQFSKRFSLLRVEKLMNRFAKRGKCWRCDGFEFYVCGPFLPQMTLITRCNLAPHTLQAYETIVWEHECDNQWLAYHQNVERGTDPFARLYLMPRHAGGKCGPKIDWLNYSSNAVND